MNVFKIIVLMSASFPCHSNILKKRNTQKVLKATLSRLLSSKFVKSFIQPFIRYHSHFLPPEWYRGPALAHGLYLSGRKSVFLACIIYLFLSNQIINSLFLHLFIYLPAFLGFICYLLFILFVISYF